MPELNKALEEMNLRKMEEFLNQCIKLGRSPKGGRPDEFDSIRCYDGFLVMNLTIDIDQIDMDGYHWLFSKDSGLMEFVEWREPKELGDVTAPMYQLYGPRQVHKYRMMNEEQEWKIDYFLKNALLPTKEQGQE